MFCNLLHPRNAEEEVKFDLLLWKENVVCAVVGGGVNSELPDCEPYPLLAQLTSLTTHFL